MQCQQNRKPSFLAEVRRVSLSQWHGDVQCWGRRGAAISGERGKQQPSSPSCPSSQTPCLWRSGLMSLLSLHLAAGRGLTAAMWSSPKDSCCRFAGWPGGFSCTAVLPEAMAQERMLGPAWHWTLLDTSLMASSAALWPISSSRVSCRKRQERPQCCPTCCFGQWAGSRPGSQPRNFRVSQTPCGLESTHRVLTTLFPNYF